MPGPVSECYEGPRDLKPENPVEEGKSIIRVILPEGRKYVRRPLFASATRTRPDNSKPYNFELTDRMEKALPYDDVDTVKSHCDLAELVNGEEAVTEVLLSMDGFLVLIYEGR